MKKKRHICIECGAKKYEKYMWSGQTFGPNWKRVWTCKNPDKCVKRSANYKK